MTNRVIKLCIFSILVISLYLIFSFKFSIVCLFKKYLGIRCFGCGLTRGFIAICNLEFIKAIRYNILSILLFIIVVMILILLVYDIIFNRNKVCDFIRYLSKYYVLLLILSLITMLINNINGI